jgi:hypothetical protein
MGPRKQKNQRKKVWSSPEARRLNYFLKRAEGYSKSDACLDSGFSSRHAPRLEKKAASGSTPKLFFMYQLHVV